MHQKSITHHVNNELLEESTSYLDSVKKLSSELSPILDLDESETFVYLNLLRTGHITASALAKDLNFSHARTYRIIEKLFNKGIVSTTFTNPKYCIPLDPNEAFKIILIKKESELNKIQKDGKKIIHKVKEMINTNHEQNTPIFHISQGTSNIYAEIENLIENCTDMMYIVTTLGDISKMYYTQIPDKIKSCKKRGVQVRLLIDYKKSEILSILSKFDSSETRTGKCPSKGRIIVVRGKQLIMSDTTINQEGHNDAYSESAFCTNGHEIVNNIFTLCDLLWKNSKPI